MQGRRLIPFLKAIVILTAVYCVLALYDHGTYNYAPVIILADGSSANTMQRQRNDTNLVFKKEQPNPNRFLGGTSSNFNNELPNAYTFVNNQWRLTDMCKSYHVYENNKDFRLVDFKTNAGKVRIFVHSKIDGISNLIARFGSFETDTIHKTMSELQKDSELNLIDIGTNVGQHSIVAALMGRHALAFDAAESNVEHVCASAHYLKLKKNITLIHNIISDTHEKRNFRYSTGGDYGSIHVDSDGIWDKMKKSYTNYFSNTTVQQSSVMLDDILKLPEIEKFKKVFIKMDVEGHEHRVLLGAKNFFNQVFVSGILMEWHWHKGRQTAETIKAIMDELNFKPYTKSNRPLLPATSNGWPQDVLWLPRQQ